MKNKAFLRPLIADEWSERGCLRLMRSCGFCFFFFAFWFAHVGNWKIKAADMKLTYPVGLDIKLTSPVKKKIKERAALLSFYYKVLPLSFSK